MSKVDTGGDKRIAWTNNYTNPSVKFGHPSHYDNAKAGERKFYNTKREPLAEQENSNENELVFGIRCVIKDRPIIMIEEIEHFMDEIQAHIQLYTSRTIMLRSGIRALKSVGSTEELPVGFG